jgi:hypothetical protein
MKRKFQAMEKGSAWLYLLMQAWQHRLFEPFGTKLK